jgi:hypothetical protein
MDLLAGSVYSWGRVRGASRRMAVTDRAVKKNSVMGIERRNVDQAGGPELLGVVRRVSQVDDEHVPVGLQDPNDLLQCPSAIVTAGDVVDHEAWRPRHRTWRRGRAGAVRPHRAHAHGRSPRLAGRSRSRPLRCCATGRSGSRRRCRRPALWSGLGPFRRRRARGRHPTSRTTSSLATSGPGASSPYWKQARRLRAEARVTGGHAGPHGRPVGRPGENTA